MSIPISQYVNITSGVGGAAVVPTRNLYGRLFTGNSLVPPQTFIQFPTAAAVGAYFGTTSEEYYRALFYFSWISKSNQQAQAIQFARFVSAACAPMIFTSNAVPYVFTLTSWTAISAGGFKLTIGGVTLDMSGELNFSEATDGADVATVMQTYIQENGTGAVFTSATVTYSATGTNPGFTFTGGATGNNVISLEAPASGINILGNNSSGAPLLVWSPQQVLSSAVGGTITTQGAIWTNGSAVETTASCLATSSTNNNDFGSFLFLNNLYLTLAQIQAAANWNATTIPNNLYMYTIPIIATNINTSTWLANYPTGLAQVAGLSITLQSPPLTMTGTLTNTSANVTVTSTTGLAVGMQISGTDIPSDTYIASITSSTVFVMSAAATGSTITTITFQLNEYPEMAPMMIAAATDYTAINSVQNYMFNVFTLTPSVTLQSTAQSYNALSVNYYGQVQNAGVNFSFYQQGVLQGTSTNPLNQNTYMNEVWLKDAMAVAILNLLLGLTQVAANNQGRSQILTTMQNIINQALNNGTISVGKQLTQLQQSYITSATGDPVAWYQVQNDGYWVDVVISPSMTTPVVYTATYTLIYSQDDVIRLVTGTNTLI